MAVPSYWNTHINQKINAINTLQNSSNRFTFGYITDMHYTNNAGNSGALLQDVVTRCNLPYFLNGGDVINNWTTTPIDQAVTQIRNVLASMGPVKNKMLLAMANHDDNSITQKWVHTLKDQQLKDELFSYNPTGAVFGPSGKYYYADDTSNKVRYIVLDSIDIPYVQVGEGLKYAGIHTYAYRQTQINWFANTALNVPSSDWYVVVCSHIPPISKGITGYDYGARNEDIMLNILKAFKEKGSVNMSSKTNVENDFKASINKSFVGHGGNVVAWLSGHVHYDNIVKMPGDIPLVTTINDNLAPWADAPVKTAGTITEQAFDVFTIDKISKTATITRIGAGNNRSFTFDVPDPVKPPDPPDPVDPPEEEGPPPITGASPPTDAEIYIFSQDDVLLTILTESTGLVSAPFRDETNSVASEPFMFTIDADIDRAKYVKEENRVIFKDKDGDFREFVIKELDDIDNIDGPQTTAICLPAWLDELSEHFILDKRYSNKDAQLALNDALAGTRYTGEVEVSLGLASTNFYRLSSVDCIWEILKVWGGEFKDVVGLVGNKVTVRKIILKQRLGADNGARFEIDHNIEEIQRTVLSYPKTAMYGWGASLEIEDENGELTGGHTRYIDFADVVWSKAKGDPVDKPLGQKWVGDPDALLKYGRKHDGQLLHRFAEFSNQDYEDASDLLMATWLNLQDNTEPIINYQLSIDLLDKDVSLGDGAVAIDREFARPIEIQTRVIAIQYDLVDIEGTAVVEMGQFLDLGADIDRELDDIRDQLNKPKPMPPIDNNSYPDIKPKTPPNVTAVGMFRAIQISWDYDAAVYVSHYEVYASQIKDFVPDTQHLIYKGVVSSTGHDVGSNETWYYRVRAVNTRGTASNYSVQVSASSTRIDFIDMADEIQEEIDSAKDRADQAVAKADNATANANDAIKEAQKGFDAAQEALGKSNDADNKAQQAIDKAQEGFDAAQSAIGKSDQAFNKANDTFKDVTALSTKVNSHTNEISTIKQTATGLQTQVTNNKNDITTVTQLANGLQTRVTDAEGNISTLTQTATQLSSKMQVVEGQLNDRALAKKLGTENINRSYEQDLATKYRPFEIGDYSLIEKDGEHVIYNGGRYSLLYSTKIVNVKDSKHYVELDVLYEHDLQGTVFVQILFYDKNGNGIGSNNSAVNLVGSGLIPTVGEWHRFSGYLDMAAQNTLRKSAYYVALGVLVRYSGFNEKAYIKNLTWKQLESQNTFEQFSAINQTIDSIATRVQTNADNYSALTQTVGGIQTEVSKKVDTTTYNSKMTQLDNLIQTKVSQKDADGKYTHQSVFNQFATGFTTRVEEIENWDINVKNILGNSKKPLFFTNNHATHPLKVSSYEDYLRYEPQNGSGLSSYSHLNTDAYPIYNQDWLGKDMVVSITVRVGKDVRLRWVFSDWGREPSKTIKEDWIDVKARDGWTTLSMVVPKNLINKNPETDAIRFMLYTHNRTIIAPYDSWIDVKDWFIGFGNKFIDYQPAPEDVNIKFSQVEQTIDGISSQVTKKVDTTTYNSYVQQTAQSLATKISATDADGKFATKSSLTQTAQGLQTQVSDKADKSTVTQLSGVVDTKISTTDANGKFATQSQLTQTSSSLQSTITSVQQEIDGMVIGASNLITQLYDEWEQGYINTSTGNAVNSTTYVRTIAYTEINGDTEYTLTAYGDYEAVIVFYTVSNGYISFINTNKTTTNTRTFKTPSNAARFKVYLRKYGANEPMFYYLLGTLYKVQLERGNRSTDWTMGTTDLATQSQFSQLSDSINLRVEKGDVINQINIDTTGILISGKKLILDGDVTVTGAFRVNNANIVSIDAAKMTTGTLDAARVSVINLNASNITTGFLNVNRLLGLSASFVADLWNGRTSSVQITGMGLETISGGQRTSLLDGTGHSFYRNNLYIGHIGTSNWVGDTSYRGLRFGLENNANYMSWGFKTSASADAYTTMLAWHKTGVKSSKGFTFSDDVTISSNNVLAVRTLSTTNYTSGSRTLELQNSTWKGYTGVFLRRGSGGAGIYMNTTTVSLISSGNAHLNVGQDGSGNYVSSTDIYNRTYTGTTQWVIVTTGGTLGRLASSRRYKLCEEEISLDYAKRFLGVNSKTWFDKRAVEDYARTLTTGEETEVQQIRRVPGLIAEDLHDQGLTMLVSYDEEGRPNGISNNAWVLYTPLIKDLYKQNEELLFKLSKLESRINQLEESA